MIRNAETGRGEREEERGRIEEGVQGGGKVLTKKGESVGGESVEKGRRDDWRKTTEDAAAGLFLFLG